MPPKRRTGGGSGYDDVAELGERKHARMDEDDSDFEDQLEEVSDDDDAFDDSRRSRKNRSAVSLVNERTKASAAGSVLGADGGAAATSGYADHSSRLTLKADHTSRPLWIDPVTGYIILEAFSPIAEQAQDFLIAIAEPISRPTYIHEYVLTPYSLYAAVSVGLEVENIISVLNRLSKTELPESIVNFIRNFTVSYGKIKLVLKENRYFIESEEAEVLQFLLKDPTIRESRVLPTAAGGSESSNISSAKAPSKDFDIAGTRKLLEQAAAKEAQAKKGAQSSADGMSVEAEKEGATKEDEEDLLKMLLAKEDEGDVTDDVTVHSFEIRANRVETVKKHCNEINYPMLEEYDFRNDHTTKNLDMDLKPTTQIRPYQEKSLSKMFGNGRARSGIIVLPCGAGKTLVGITAACTIRKSTLVLCTSAVSVAQWKQQFLMWSSIREEQVAVFTSENKKWFQGEAGIVISTYTMVANTRQRSHLTANFMRKMAETEWGFLLLDEVHVVPANMFRRVLTQIAAHTKLGLTATLVREDDRISDLNFLIGPKLYEANWMDLASQGHIAKVQCAEVWCPMTPEFYREYKMTDSRRKQVLYAMNPNKFQACQFLIQYHEERGDKIIVFSDNVYALKAYATKLGKPFIYGATSHTERTAILQQFQHNPACNTMFLSKVGDTSIDLPEATCLIQISSHYGSRRQEAQRLGRILRAKRRNDEGFNAFFYSLVSKDTEEMYYSNKRQQFLVDQGYAFKVITKLPGIQDTPGLCYTDPREQQDLLVTVINADMSAITENDANTARAGQTGQNKGSGSAGALAAARRQGNLQSLSGGDAMAYMNVRR